MLLSGSEDQTVRVWDVSAISAALESDKTAQEVLQPETSQQTEEQPKSGAAEVSGQQEARVADSAARSTLARYWIPALGWI